MDFGEFSGSVLMIFMILMFLCKRLVHLSKIRYRPSQLRNGFSPLSGQELLQYLESNVGSSKNKLKAQYAQCGHMHPTFYAKVSNLCGYLSKLDETCSALVLSA